MSDPYEHPAPAELTKHVTAICGQRGVNWLCDLPLLVRELERDWGIAVGAPFEKGEYNFVAEALLSDGAEAVLKIAPPFEMTEIHGEAEFLKNRNGKGIARLIAEDRSRRALLIERVRPGITLDVHFASDPFACVDPAINVLRTLLARPPVHVSDFQVLDEWFTRFTRFRGTAFPQDRGERAMAIYERLRIQSEQIYYLHGDFHPGNIVTAGGPAYLAIDPKGVFGHLAYDIAVFLNNLHWWQKGKHGVEAELSKALRIFAKAFEIEESDLRDAAFASMVIGAWWNFDEMPEHYENQVALADIWDI